MNNLIDLPGDAYFMNEALRLATKAFEKEEVPVGAIVVREGKIIGRAYNQVELLKDATAHAEMLAITQAEAAVGEAFGTEPKPLAVVSQEFERRPGAVTKDVDRAAQRIVAQRLPTQGRKAIDPLAEIDGVPGQKDVTLGRELQH